MRGHDHPGVLAYRRRRAWWCAGCASCALPRVCAMMAAMRSCACSSSRHDLGRRVTRPSSPRFSYRSGRAGARGEESVTGPGTRQALPACHQRDG
eukprot:364965-Chlamydomonas_euryale.AAC.15